MRKELFEPVFTPVAILDCGDRPAAAAEVVDLPSAAADAEEFSHRELEEQYLLSCNICVVFHGNFSVVFVSNR